MPVDQHDNPDDHLHLNIPYLAVPYWEENYPSQGDAADIGDVRPVITKGVLSYLCSGIQPKTAYVPGGEMTVVVAVRNWGGGVNTSNAIVTLWWEPPATTFLAMSASRLLGVQSVDLRPRGELSKTEPFRAVIATALQHVCLIARIDHPLDPSPRDPNDIETPLPGVERHWAQRNIAVISPGADGSVDFTFAGANPFWKEEAFVFEVKPLQRERLQQLARSVRADPVEVDAEYEIRESIDVLNARLERRPNRSHVVRLNQRTRHLFQLRMRLGAVPADGQFAAFEIVQSRRGEDFPLGGIALVIRASDRARR